MNKFINNPSSIGYQDNRQLYADIERLKSMSLQLPNYRTVFTDISEEWSKCTQEEQVFINNDEKYVEANLAYQQAFNSFLLEMVGPQFLGSQYGKSAEYVLIALKQAKEKYRQKTDVTIKNVQEQNEKLRAELAELKKLLE